MDYPSKRPYQALSITVNYLEIEHSIAAGSATVSPITTDQRVMEEWDEDPTDTRTIVW
ncbi:MULTISPECIES: hypothetical protein [Sphingobacterium]|uniref:Uncharacterized protein n=1 Tax=Sphingobacterium populi TaxID=1812824 RepID=A0ABW5UA35_9SPHI|nr:hypothetical protein [Sphingobacterium sp. CFCC 11742]